MAGGWGGGEDPFSKENLENVAVPSCLVEEHVLFSPLGGSPEEQLFAACFWVTGGGQRLWAGQPGEGSFAQAQCRQRAVLGPPGPYQVSPPTTHPGTVTSALSSPLSCCPASSKHFLVMLKACLLSQKV